MGHIVWSFLLTFDTPEVLRHEIQKGHDYGPFVPGGLVDGHFQSAAEDERCKTHTGLLCEYFAEVITPGHPQHATPPCLSHQRQAIGYQFHSFHRRFHSFFKNMQSPIPTFSFCGGWQSPVPNSIIRNDKLSDRARMLWIFIRSYASPGSPVPFPKNSTMCRNLGWSRDTLWKYMKELEKEGFMYVQRSEFKPNHYILSDSPLSNFTESENFRHGEFPTEKKPDPKSTHSEEDKPYKRAKGKRAPFVSRSETHKAQPVVQSAARRSVAGGAVSTSSSLISEDEAFELDDRGKQLQEMWNQYYPIAFRRQPKLTQADLEALQILAHEFEPKEMMAIILMAWSCNKIDGDFDPRFYCTRYSNSPKSIWMTVARDGECNLDKMMKEMGWRGRPLEIKFGYDWIGRLQKQQLGQPVVNAQ